MCLQAILVFALVAAGYAQGAADSGEDALQSFASRPTAQVAWSQEVNRIEADGVRAVVSAIEMSDSTQAASSVRGVRIDLVDANGEDHVYISEQRLAANIQAVEEISAVSPIFLARHPTEGHMSCFGSCYFRTRPQGTPSVSECQTANSRFLAVRGERDFRFNALDPQAFAAALTRASEALARR